MDDVLKQLVDNNKTKEELVANKIDEKLIDMLQNRIKANAFKCKLPTIANINFKG
jgi:NAD+ synthase